MRMAREMREESVTRVDVVPPPVFQGSVSSVVAC